MPPEYTGLDTSRLTALYFAVVGLDLLGALDEIENKQEIIDYIYGMQLPCDDALYIQQCGFMGSSYAGQPFAVCRPCTSASPPDAGPGPSEPGKEKGATLSAIPTGLRKHLQGHIAMAYTALATLITLGDNLAGVDRTGLLRGAVLLSTEHTSSGFYRNCSLTIFNTL